MLWTPDDVGALWSRIFDRVYSNGAGDMPRVDAAETATDAVERILKASQPTAGELAHLLTGEINRERDIALVEMGKPGDISQQSCPPDEAAIRALRLSQDFPAMMDAAGASFTAPEEVFKSMSPGGPAFKAASVDSSHPIDAKLRCTYCGEELTGSRALGGAPFCNKECDDLWQALKRKGPTAVKMTSLPPFVARAAVIRADSQEEADAMREKLLSTWKEKPAVCTCKPSLVDDADSQSGALEVHEPHCNLRAGTVAPTEEPA